MTRRAGRPIGFLSYATFDDEHSGGWISDFCRSLSAEVRAQTGKPFPIFQDRRDVLWGQNWRSRINGALEAATFLFPVMTPSFFQSSECRRELGDFLRHEQRRRRNDLVFPIHFIRCKHLSQKNSRSPSATLVQAVKNHQVCDLIDLRFQKVDDMEVRRFLATMASHVCSAIDRIEHRRTQDNY